MTLIASKLKSIINRPGLIFVGKSVDDLNAVNIGLEMSLELSQLDIHQQSFPMAAKDCLCNILDGSIHETEEGNKYLAVSNTNILFERQLALDIEAIIRSYARSAAVIFETQGKIDGNLFFPFSGHPEIRIDLTGMTINVFTE